MMRFILAIMFIFLSATHSFAEDTTDTSMEVMPSVQGAENLADVDTFSDAVPLSEKAEQDSKSSGRKNDFNRMKFMNGLVLPIGFIVQSVFFLLIGFIVCIKKKPMIFSARWMFVVIFICFIPATSFSTMIGGFSRLSPELLIMLLLPKLMFLIMLIFIWMQMQGYMLFGVEERSFRAALIETIEENDMEWKEEISLMRIPEANLDIQIAMQSWMGAGQIKNKNKTGQDMFRKIAEGLRKRFSNGEVSINSTAGVYYLVAGALMLALSFCMMLAY